MTLTETERLENKRSLGGWKEIVETVAAFATATGGTIRVGVDPKGAPAGVQIGKGSLEELANRIKLNTDPPQFPSVSVEGSANSAIVTVEVQESPIKPVWAFGRPFKRVGPTNQRLSRDEIGWLVEQTTGRTWDSLPREGLRLEHLDRRLVEEFLRRASLPLDTETEGVLEMLELQSPQGLTHAAALLFTDFPPRWVIDAQTKCGRFLGNDSVHFLDEQTFEGSVLQQVDQALAFVTRNTRQAIRITGQQATHERVPEYPEAAVREAITNAVCHRDYAAAGTVQVRIYDDRLEVWNPARLPADFDLETLYQQHRSRPPNRQIAAAFFRARLIEQWGTGTLRIAAACAAAALPRPEFCFEMATFIVRFRRAAAQPVTGQASLNERQRQVLAYVEEHGGITRNRYQKMFDLSERHALRELNALAHTGLLVRSGRGPATIYLTPAEKIS